ncbi:MAG: GGDEF domain-containing protein [Acidimicrobiales bacterium]
MRSGASSRLLRHLVRHPLVAVAGIAGVSTVMSVVITVLVSLTVGRREPAWMVPSIAIATVVPLAVATPMSGVLLTLVHRLEEARLLAERLASTDLLTGALNRRQLIDLARSAFDLVHAGSPLCVVLFDIDDFKTINDTYGHQGGDDVLVGVAAACGEMLRAGDLLARWGGEEFVVLIPGAEREAGANIAERLREAIAQTRVDTPSAPGLGVTVSVGVTCTDGRAVGLDTLISEADHAMYRAKRSGKNRVVPAWALAGVAAAGTPVTA